MRHQDAVPLLILALDDGNANVRAAMALGAFGPSAADALPVLGKLENDQDGDVREAAEQAARKINPEPTPGKP